MRKVKRVKRVVCVNDLFLVGNGQLNVCLEATKKKRPQDSVQFGHDCILLLPLHDLAVGFL
jgi:hypothetical protein